jgi:hypothetical protein
VKLALVPHRETPCAALTGIEVEVRRASPDGLRLTYVAHGDIRALALPPFAGVARADELWKATCFEAFLKVEGAEDYVELNFSPSGGWAAYRFDGYRVGMKPLELAFRPWGRLVVGRDRLTFRAAWAPRRPQLRIALSAVIEETSGSKSYWALAHPPGRPDFHADAGFAALLA